LAIIAPKRLKVGEDIEGTTKKTGFKGRIVDQTLSQNRPKWKKSWENATETIESGRGIKKGRWPLMKVKLISLVMKPEDARLIQRALDSLDKDIGEESDDSDSFCSYSVDIFGYIWYFNGYLQLYGIQY
jgi:hypothetical protein